MTELIVFRALQGLGAGAMLPINQAIIGDIFPPAQRAKWTGILMSVFGFATIVGPLLGGWITDNIGWRWTFYVNLPVGIVALVFAACALPGHVSCGKHAIDWLGAAFLVAGRGAPAAGLQLGRARIRVVVAGDHRTVRVLGSHVGGVLPARDAGRRAGAQPSPVPEQHLHGVDRGQRHPVGGDVRRHHVPAPVRPGRHGQDGHELRASILMPMMLAAIVSSIGAGQLLARTGRYKAVVIGGFICVAVGGFLLSRMTVDTTSAHAPRLHGHHGTGARRRP